MLQLKCFELKIILVINMSKNIVCFSFYCNLKIVRFFWRTLYNMYFDCSFILLSLCSNLI